MLITFLIFAVVISLAIIGFLFYFSPSFYGSTIPGLASSDKREGNLRDVALAENFPSFLRSLHKRFGSVASFWFGTTLCVSVNDKKSLAELKLVFDRPVSLFEYLMPVLGPKSILFASGEDGRRRHRKYSRAFSSKIVDNEFLSKFNSIANELAVTLSRLPEDEHIPLHEYMMAMAVKSLAKTQLGVYFRDNSKIRQLHDLYEKVIHRMDATVKTVPFNPKTSYDRFEELPKLNLLLTKAVNEHKKARESGDDEKAPFIDALIENSSDDEELISDAVTFLFGGLHTTGSFLTWFLYYLSHYTKYQDEVREELLRVLGPSRDVEPQDFKELKFTRQCINETLRLSHIGQFSVARIVEDREIRLEGYIVPPGTPIIHAIGAENVNDDLPNVFDPSQVSPNIDDSSFGFGVRQCPGYDFSKTEVLVVASNLLRKFKFSLAFYLDYLIEPKIGVVSEPESDIWVKIKPV